MGIFTIEFEKKCYKIEEFKASPNTCFGGGGILLAK